MLRHKLPLQNHRKQHLDGVYTMLQEWNGTNWSEFQTTTESGLDGGHYNQAGTGTSNAALQFAGQTPYNYSSTGYDRSFEHFVSIMVQIGVNVLL